MVPLDRYRVGENDQHWKLKKLDPADHDGVADKAAAEARLVEIKRQLAEWQGKLFADGRYAVLLVLQAMDAGGKDGTIKHVMSGLNPQGCSVTSFNVPSALESRHDYLWRVHQVCPPRGMFTILNRSHYEEVLVVRVHAERLLPEWARRRKEIWPERYEQINAFERMLTQNNTIIRKCFLNISKDEQKRRLEKRIQDPAHNWKFRREDLDERACWDAYMEAYEQALRQTSTPWAPWYVVPADHKWYRNLVVAELLLETLKGLKLAYPPADPNELKDIKLD